MSWHHPDLYFFLALFTGLAALLAIIYECIRRRPVYLQKAKPLDGLQRACPARPIEERVRRPSDFGRLCGSIEDLPPKEQASRVHEYFGILGGARPGRDRSGKRPVAYTPALNKLRNRFRHRFTPGEIQRLEQRSRTRL
jgi:hypothetical protein